MRPITKEIKKLDRRVYKWMNKQYPIPKPILKVVHYRAGTKGSFNRKKNSIRINSNNPLDSIHNTLIHEYYHLINHVHFNPQNKRLGHNKKFWELCINFGLSNLDYGYGLTKTMESAYLELNKRPKVM